MNIIEDILEPVCTSLGDAINYGARSLIKGGCGIFNMLIDKACEFFTQTPLGICRRGRLADMEPDYDMQYYICQYCRILDMCVLADWIFKRSDGY